MIVATVENSNDGIASTVGWQPLKCFRVITENSLPLHVQTVRELIAVESLAIDVGIVHYSLQHNVRLLELWSLVLF